VELGAARQLGESLLGRHGLRDWRLVFDSAKTRAGVCRPARREIGLSRVLTVLHGEAEVRDTLLHEIAHALVGPEHGHDAVWRRTAVAIGSSGRRCMPPDAPRAPQPWLGTCPAGHTVGRYRQPARATSCSRCSARFDLRHLHSWTWHGRVVPMSAAYRRDLARAQRAAAR
jgi:hypothetical protein